MLEMFARNIKDDCVTVIDGDTQYTFGELKQQIAWQIDNLKNKKENVVILGESNYHFFVHFMAAIYAGKNIFLLTDRTRIQNLDFEYELLDKTDFGKKVDYSFPKIDTKKAIFKFFTSGSTGVPKTVMKSLYNILYEAEDIIEEFNLTAKDYNVLSTTTISHSYGLTYFIMFLLYGKFKVYTRKIPYPDYVDKENAILISTPAFLSSVLKHNIDFKVNPEYIFSAGSKLDNNIFEYLEKKSKMVDIYGCTEVGVVSFKTSSKENAKLFKSVKIDVHDEYIDVYSEYSYFDKVKINDKVELDGRNIIIKNRTDRIFKIYDKCVSADELENNLKTNELVKDCYIIQNNDKLACLCALSDKGKDFILNNDIAVLNKTLKQYLLKYSEIIPQRWKYIDEIPMTFIGKINKKFIANLFNVNISLPVILGRTLTDNSVVYKILFYGKCNFFNGHFPSFKLVPGVVQLYYAKTFANNHFNLNISEGQWKRIKFSNVIKPDSIVNLKLERKNNQVSYEYYSDLKNYSSGVFLCENVFKGMKDDLVSV